MRRTKTPRHAEIGPCSIIGIYIDPPWRVLARVAPTVAPRVGRAARAPHSPRRSERASAASALLTALEAFGSDALPRGTANEAASARLKNVLASLSGIGGGAALEILAGPRPPQTGGHGCRRAKAPRRINPPGSRADARRVAHPRHRLVARRFGRPGRSARRRLRAPDGLLRQLARRKRSVHLDARPTAALAAQNGVATASSNSNLRS